MLGIVKLAQRRQARRGAANNVADFGDTPLVWATTMTRDESNPQGPVVRAPCFRFLRGVPVRGVLIVDPERLRFEPKGRLARAVQQEPLEVALSDIDEVRIAGVDRHVVVVSGELSYRFTGRGARGLVGPLQVLRAAAWRPGGATVIDLFGSPDHAMIRGPASLYVNRFMAVPGTVALSSRRLLFTPTSRLEMWAWGTGRVELPVHELEDVHISGVLPVLHLRGERRSWRIGGSLAPALCGAIRILQGGELRELIPPGERELVVDSWGARLGRGDERPRPGTVVVGSHRLVFVQSGSGGGIDEIALHDVTRLGPDPASTRRLLLQLGDRTVVILVAHAPERARELARLVLAVRTRDEPPVLRNGEIEAEGFDAQLAPWVEAELVPPHAADERTLIAGAALQWVGADQARRGWLGLTSQRAIFVPTGPTMAAAPPTVFPIDHDPSDDRFGERAVMLGPEAAAQILPRGGRLFVDAFWAAWRRLRPSTGKGTVRGSQAVDAILGTALFVQLLDGGEALVTLPYACVSRSGDSLSLGFQGTPDRAIEVGRLLRVEVARVDGLYQFRAMVRSIDRVPHPSDEKATGIQLLLDLRSDVQRVEHRSGFRVKTNANVDIYVLEKRRDAWFVGETVSGCALDDLSIVGCGLWAPHQLPEDARLRIPLPLAEGELDVHATVARFEAPRTHGGPWRYGLRFVSLPESSRDRLHADILLRQRSDVARRLEAEEQ